MTENRNVTDNNSNEKWWWKLSFLERCLMITIICATLVIVALIPSGQTSIKNTCVSEECIHSASNILNHMDRNIEPCDNFYEFACGNFLENSVVPEDKQLISPAIIMNQKVEQKVIKFLDDDTDKNEPRHFKLLKNFYNNCLNEADIDEKGVKPLERILKKIGGWPAVEGDNWNDQDFDWKELIYNLREEGLFMSFLFDFKITYEINGTHLVLDTPKFYVPTQNLTKGFNDTIVKAYHTYMVNLVELFGGNQILAEKELRESIELEIELANSTIREDEKQLINIRNNTFTIKEMEGNFSIIPWEEYFNKILIIKEIKHNDTVYVKNLDYLKKLNNSWEKMSKRAQANYIISKVVVTMAKYLGKDVLIKRMEFLMDFDNLKKIYSRKERCVDYANNLMNFIINALYVKKHITDDSKNSTIEMIKNICETFKNILIKAEWLDKVTKEKSLKKLESMNAYVAHVDDLLDEKALVEFYSKLEITSGDFFQSVLNVSQFNTNYTLNLLGDLAKIEKLTASLNPLIVNAFYMPAPNSIYIPAAVIQGAFFMYNRPQYINYGTMGFVIGHEISHGFDDTDFYFDEEGNLMDLWEPESMKKFLLKVKCIIEQYGNYTYEEVGMHLDGNRTKAEDVADNVGIKLSYMAYKEWVRKNGEEPMLPGLDYTPSQLFWISLTQSWCTKYSQKHLKSLFEQANHSPEKFRILGTFSNRPEFANDFNCAEGSKMNPKNKCFIW